MRRFFNISARFPVPSSPARGGFTRRAAIRPRGPSAHRSGSSGSQPSGRAPEPPEKTPDRSGIYLAVGLPLALYAGASLFEKAGEKQNAPEIPAWVNDFKVSPEDEVCRITDLKTGREYISRKGERINMARGFSVASSPSSCNVTLHQPYKDDTCQLRGWPIEPIC